jgi:hypothetical protein
MSGDLKIVRAIVFPELDTSEPVIDTDTNLVSLEANGRWSIFQNFWRSFSDVHGPGPGNHAFSFSAWSGSPTTANLIGRKGQRFLGLISPFTGTITELNYSLLNTGDSQTITIGIAVCRNDNAGHLVCVGAFTYAKAMVPYEVYSESIAFSGPLDVNKGDVIMICTAGSAMPQVTQYIFGPIAVTLSKQVV